MHAKTVLHESTYFFVAAEFLVSGAYRKNNCLDTLRAKVCEGIKSRNLHLEDLAYRAPNLDLASELQHKFLILISALNNHYKHL